MTKGSVNVKKLFSIESKGLFWIEEENAIYSIFDRKSNSHCFYDVNGKVLPNYKRPKTDYKGNNIEYNLESNDDDTLVFNKYGVACGDGCLVDKDGNEIPDTKLNLEDDCDEHNRYFTFSLITKEQSESIDKCGTASGIKLDVYDTKTRKYVLRDIPECKLNIYCFDGEPEVILAAVEMLQEFETVEVCKKGTILGTKDGWVTVFNYYG